LVAGVVLGEAAHHSRHQPRVQGALKQRQDGVPQDIVDLSWKAQQRLHLRYRHLCARIGRPKALTAVARELAGFVWALGQRMAAPRRLDLQGGGADRGRARHSPRASSLGSMRYPTRDVSRRQLGDGSMSCRNGSADPRISG
jgi:hypothetical protein